MLIVHSLNTNFTYHLHCPLCGANFIQQKQLEVLSKYKKKLIKNKRIVFSNGDGIDRNTMKLRKTVSCSKCTFEIIYTLDLNNEIKRVN